MPLPRYLYHYAPKSCRDSIESNGLVGKNNGRWAIYLAESPETWRGLHESADLWRVSTKVLNENDFSVVDSDLDEVLYWGKIDEEIRIPRAEIIRIKGQCDEIQFPI